MGNKVVSRISFDVMMQEKNAGISKNFEVGILPYKTIIVLHRIGNEISQFFQLLR